MFITIVDDFSRYTWIFLIKHKSDFLACLRNFYCYVETQLGKHIKIVRTDNARELSQGETLLIQALRWALVDSSLLFQVCLKASIFWKQHRFDNGDQSWMGSFRERWSRLLAHQKNKRQMCLLAAYLRPACVCLVIRVCKGRKIRVLQDLGCATLLSKGVD